MVVMGSTGNASRTARRSFHWAYRAASALANPRLVVGERVWVCYRAGDTKHGAPMPPKRITTGRVSRPIGSSCVARCRSRWRYRGDGSVRGRGWAFGCPCRCLRGSLRVELLSGSKASCPASTLLAAKPSVATTFAILLRGTGGTGSTLQRWSGYAFISTMRSPTDFASDSSMRRTRGRGRIQRTVETDAIHAGADEVPVGYSGTSCKGAQRRRLQPHSIRSIRGVLAGAAAVAITLSACATEQHELPSALPDIPSVSALQTTDLLSPVRARVDGLYGRLADRPSDPASNGELGMLLHAHRMFETARTLYLRAHFLDSDSFQWAYYLGVVDSARGRTAEAVAWFQKALALDPDYVPAQIRAAEGLLETGELGASERLYRGILDRSPVEPRARLGLGRVCAARGELRQAVQEYEAACRLNPGFAEARYALAMALRELNRNEEAQHHLSLYRQSPASQPSFEDPVLQRVLQQEAGADAYTRAGVERVNAGEVELGAQLLERAVDLNPQDEGASSSLLTAYGQMGDQSRAADHFRKSLEVFPASEDIHFNYATILAQQGKFVEASELFARVLEINPQHADSHANLGYIREESGDVATAVDHYLRALEHDPSNPTARFRLGRLALAQGLIQEAVGHFHAALDAARDQRDQLLYGIATASAMAGDFAEASRVAREAHATALSFGHTALAEAIEADLVSFEQRAGSRQ